MHVELGGYHVRDIEFSAAFDMAQGKVGRDLAEAILAPPNNTIRFAEVPLTGVEVQRGPTLDGLGRYLRERGRGIGRAGRRCRPHAARDRHRRAGVLSAGRLAGGDALVRRAGAGGRLRLRQLHPGLHRLARAWRRRFEERRLPIIGDDIKSQVGATIVHRMLANLFRERGVRLDRTYQLNFGGNTDFLNMLERERLESKKISKTQRRHQPARPRRCPPGDVHVGPSDYVPWLTDRKWCYIRHGRARPSATCR